MKKLIETTKCCFFVDDLRIAGLVIGGFMLFSLVVSIPQSSGFVLIASVICAPAWVALIYGILKKRTVFMIPSILVLFGGLCVSIVYLILIPIAGLFFHDKVQRYLYEELNQNVDATRYLVIFWFIMIITAVCQFHFGSVIYSLRKSMNENPSENQHNANVMYPNLA